MTKIVFDYGHGPGEEYNRGGIFFNEGDNNFYFGEMVRKELEKYSGVEIFLTRPTINHDPDLDERAIMFNDEYADLYISWHSNAFRRNQASGVEAFYYSENPNTSNELLARLCKATSDLLDIPNRGVKDYDFAVLAYGNTADVKTLFEMFFHDNEYDAKQFLAKKNELAKAYAKTIADYYGLKSKQPTVAKPNTKPQKQTKLKAEDLYRVQLGAFTQKSNAEKLLKDLENKGFKGFIVAPKISKKEDAQTISPQKTEADYKKAAQEIYDGENYWGTGELRRKQAKERGFDPEKLQDYVDELF
ncbi:MAG: N-acetylmuramoyl-L-alanine amidase [Tissierellia bacterium]|nr:N-acetylmuramoyl-L-alanine amidase [Tissierellia bacterium]